MPIPDGLYPGDYLKPVGEALAAEHGAALNQMPEQNAGCRSPATSAITMMMDDDPRRSAALDVHHDVFYSERSLTVREARRSARNAPERPISSPRTIR